MADAKQPKYRRVLLKLSGEALAKDADGIFNHGFIDEIAAVVKKCVDAGVEVGVVVGAGNIWRGRQGVNMDRVRADHMGMLATVINALALQDAFERAGRDDPCHDGRRNESDGRTLYTQSCRSSLGKGQGYDFRLRPGLSVFFDGYRSGASRGGDQCGRRAAGEKY